MLDADLEHVSHADLAREGGQIREIYNGVHILGSRITWLNPPLWGVPGDPRGTLIKL